MALALEEPILSPDAWRGLSALRVQPRGPRCGWGVSDGGCCGAIVWGIVCQGHTVMFVKEFAQHLALDLPPVRSEVSVISFIY